MSLPSGSSIACEEGTTVESEFVTLVHNGEAMEYSSMRDLIRDEVIVDPKYLMDITEAETMEQTGAITL